MQHFLFIYRIFLADFFDNKPMAKPKVESPLQEKTPSKSKKVQFNKSNTLPAAASANPSLPEGFFDDPKKDAKARKVEYKDPELEEWEKFQKSIQKEEDVSVAIVAFLFHTLHTSTHSTGLRGSDSGEGRRSQ